MSQQPPLSAQRVTELVTSTRDDVERMSALERGRPADRAATMALLEGLKWWQWRVVMGCAHSLGAASEGAPEAVEGLLSALRHPESSVRNAAAKSLGKLTERVSVSPLPLFEAYLTEETHLAFLETGRALLASLKTSTLTPEQGLRLQKILEQMEAVKLRHLPIGGTMVARGPAPSPRPVGFLARLMGKAPPAEPPPRVPPADDRIFLEPEDGQLHDYPEIVSQVAQVYAKAPGDPEVRFALVLKLCRMPLAYFVTTTGLVLLAAELADTLERRAALLAEVPRWVTPGDPTRGNRLACSLASAVPSLRLDLFRLLLQKQESMDWSNWSYPLRNATPAELEPLVEAALEAPEKDLLSWLRLLKETPVEPVLPVLGRALHSQTLGAVTASLERLRKFGQPVSEQIGDAELLKQRWADQPSVLQPLESVVGQSARPSGGTTAPAGFQEPLKTAEWTLPEMACNPFSRGEKQDWKESLRQLDAFCTDGETFFLTTTEQLVLLRSGQPPRPFPWPENFRGVGLSLLAVGLQGELLFQYAGGSQAHLFLWSSAEGNFRRVQPSVPDDEVPNGTNFVTDGRNYGWAEAGVWKMSHFESDPGHHADIAYHLDRGSATLRAVKADELKGMRPVEGHKLDTGDYHQTTLEFAFSQDGAFRLCDARRLAIRASGENPIHSSGRTDGKWALHMEVFPSRLCRLSFWECAT